jgi:mRNA-degrading endonuclease toxin of MazEF toxin-antitoxin module
MVKSKRGKVTGVALADHIKCLDWQARGVVKADDAEEETIAHIAAMIRALLIL